jgi:peptide deformylase
MILEIVQYGHPALRQPGRRIEAVTDEIRQLATDMIETMHQAEGIGLAAQQIGQPLLLFVLDLSAVKDRPSTLQINGQSVDPASVMPLVLINPEIAPSGSPATGPEGCLSFPEVYGDTAARNRSRSGGGSARRTGGVSRERSLSRAVQHEHDPTGILFIDRMTDQVRQHCSRR